MPHCDRSLSIAAAAVLLVAAPLVSLQLPEPNAAGIRTGHIHLIVPDMGEHLRIWKLLGGEEKRSGDLQLLPLFQASTSC
jgi:hypothetical protein